MSKLARTLGWSVYTAALTALVLPMYPRLLGLDVWGQVALLLIAQAGACILESGLAQAATRDFSLRPGNVRGLLTLWLPTYVAFGLLAAALTTLLAISMGGEAAWPIAMFAVVAGCTTVSGLLSAAEIASGRQDHTALRVAATATARHGLGLLAALNGAGATAIAAIFAVVGLMELTWATHRLKLVDVELPTMEWMRGLAWARRRAAWIIFASALGSWIAQGDRILVAHSLEPSAVGLYLIVSQYCMALLQFQYPVQRELYAHFNPGAERHQWLPFPPRAMLRTIGLSSVPPLLLGIMAPWLFPWLLGQPEVASQSVTTIAWLLLVGVAVNGVGAVLYLAISRMGSDFSLVFANAVGGIVGVLAFSVALAVNPAIAAALYWLAMCCGVTLALALAIWHERPSR